VSAVLRSEERVYCWGERTCEKPVMIFPIKKRINTDLLIDERAVLYTGETPISVGTH